MSCMSPSRVFQACVILIALSTRSSASEELFRTRIAPVFERHCVRCHGSEPKGGLSLVSKADFANGGDSGDLVDPEEIEASLLLESISGAKPRMPKASDPLSAADVDAIRDWVKQGAKWPDGLTLRNRQFDGTAWWSLQPLKMPEIPTISEQRQSAIRNPIDAFIVARLEKEGLTPSAEASRATLIRRVTFDLIGLPPTPEEIDAFVNDTEPRAYERVVERLLDSPRYGERWARHWLDVVHFGETHGYDKDKPRPNAWPYRDYVIRAFNSDLPYGQFLKQQIAGDVVATGTRDGIEALGFLAAGPWDFIGHAEVPETKIDGRVARHLDRDDMVTNTMQTFASFTVQCAQCHDHKFDPITQEDYYSLQAVFSAIDRTDKQYDTDPAISSRRAQLAERKKNLESERATVEKQVADRAGPRLLELDQEIATKSQRAGKGVTQGVEFGYHSEIAVRPDVAKWVQVELAEPAVVASIILHPCHDDFANIGSGFGFPIRYKIEIADDAAFETNRRVLADRTAEDQPNPGIQAIAFSVPEADQQSTQFIRITATRLAPRSNDFIFSLAEMEILDKGKQNVARKGKVRALDSIEAAPRWRATNLIDSLFPTDGGQDAIQLAMLKKVRDTLWNKHILPSETARLQRVSERLSSIATEQSQLPPLKVAYVGAIHRGEGAFRGTGHDGGKPRPISLLDRGNVEKPIRPAFPGALSAVSALNARFALPDPSNESARREALANWLAAPENPLTWRSIVNRVWHYHFGKGLVETPNDFGRNGKLPSHPELLDWLAMTFRDDGQSLKGLHRLIVTSGTYRQESAESQTAMAIDADNRLLWRMSRRRLEAEAIRDAVLAVSGKLDLTMGGPSFQDFVVEKPEHSPHYEYELADPSDRRIHRRSVYRFIVRSQQQPFMTTLDCADPSMQVDRRNESLSALQALALLNNPLMLHLASAYADKLTSLTGSDRERIERAFIECTGRKPTPGEMTDLLDYASENGLANLCRVLFNLNEFVFVD